MKTKKNKIKWCVLLTTTVNVNNKNILISQDKKEDRISTYLKSIRQWIMTDLPIVVVENSGYTFPELKNTRVEVITFKGDTPEFKKFLNKFGYVEKGIHELHSIRYACKSSNLIKKCTHIMKITGRYFIPSLEKIMNGFPYRTKAVRQHNPKKCELIGCRKDMIPYIFDYILFDGNKINSHIESVYRYRISKINHEILPVMQIEPTRQGGIDVINTEL